MKVGIIAPTSFLSKYCNTGLQYCYASLVLSNKSYCEFYRQRRIAGDTIIMDHSPSIPRKPIGSTLFWRAYWKVQPQYIVLPSEDFSCEKTIPLAIGYQKEYKKICNTIGVPQGCNLDEVIECYKRIRRYSTVIGLPISMEKVISRNLFLSKVKVTKPTIFLEILNNPKTEFPDIDTSLGIVTSFPLRRSRTHQGLPQLHPLYFLEGTFHNYLRSTKYSI